jgi:hypothetical protein
MVPTTWVNQQVLIEYATADGSGASTSAVLLDWCGLGLIVAMNRPRAVIPWDSIRWLELRGP